MGLLELFCTLIVESAYLLIGFPLLAHFLLQLGHLSLFALQVTLQLVNLIPEETCVSPSHHTLGHLDRKQGGFERVKTQNSPSVYISDTGELCSSVTSHLFHNNKHIKGNLMCTTTIVLTDNNTQGIKPVILLRLYLYKDCSQTAHNVNQISALVYNY